MKRAFVFAVAVCGTAFSLPTGATAQETGQADMAAMMEAIAPDENHAALEPLAGSWEHAVTFYPAPGAPGMEMTATSSAEMTMGGRYLASELDGSFLDAPFTGSETMGYDKVKGKYFSTWIDNFSTGPMVLWGDYDPATKTFTLEGTVSEPMSGNPEIPVRNTIQVMDDGSLQYENWAAGPDGTLFKSMEIHSTRP